MTMDAVQYYTLAILLVAAGVCAWLTNLLTLPGNWIVVALAALFAWLGPQVGSLGVSWLIVGILTALAVLGEIIEFAASAWGASKQGASRRAAALSILGAMFGGIAGATAGLPIPVIGPIVGAVLGGALGAFGGAYLGETWKGRTHGESMLAGRGAFSGRLWGMVGKIAVGAVMIVLLGLDALVM
jgi:uncharacterized protein YqgC (DUF456 family)